MKSITRTEFNFPKQTAKYVGKVRDVYTIDNKYMVMIATNPESATAAKTVRVSNSTINVKLARAVAPPMPNHMADHTSCFLKLAML